MNRTSTFTGPVRPMGASPKETAMMSARTAHTRLALAVILALVMGCGDTQAPSSDNPSGAEAVLASLIVSNPASAAHPTASANGAAADAGPVYASLPPGSVPGGERVVIENWRTGAAATAPMAEGGFDPVSITALAGDTLGLRIHVPGDSTDREFIAVVPDRHPPIVVRTDPPPQKRDVPLNAVLLVVFSEPLDPATLTDSAVQLLLGDAPGAGTPAFGDAEHLTVTFTPAAALAPGADYTLHLTQAIADLDGDALEAPVTVGFATVAAPPSSSQLAFVRDGQIHLVNADGTGLVRLSDGPGDADPAWSPDGRRIAFASHRNAATEIYVMDADGSKLVRRTTGAAPSWSPDGQWIVYGSGDLMLMKADADGTSPIRFTDDGGWEAHAAWSPDGTRIAFVSDWVTYDFTADIFIATLTTSQWTRITDNYVGFDGQPCWGLPSLGCDPLTQYFQPAWSPDGQRLAVVTCLYAFTTCDASTVSVMNADGSGLVQLAATSGFAKPTWSPDGQVIAFTRFGSIAWVAVDGTAQGIVVSDGHSPAWRP